MELLFIVAIVAGALRGATAYHMWTMTQFAYWWFYARAQRVLARRRAKVTYPIIDREEDDDESF